MACLGRSSATFEWVPILHILIFFTSALIAVLLAIYKRQVKYKTPILCNAGAWFPSYYVFSGGLTLSAAFFLVTAWIEHYHILNQLDLDDSQSSSLRAVSIITLIFGIFVSLLQAGMGVVSFHDFPRLHNAIAISFMVSGVIYAIVLTSLSSRWDSSTMLAWRVTATVFCGLGALSLFIPAIIERKRNRIRMEAKQQIAIEMAEARKKRNRRTNMESNHRTSKLLAMGVGVRGSYNSVSKLRSRLGIPDDVPLPISSPSDRKESMVMSVSPLSDHPSPIPSPSLSLSSPTPSEVPLPQSQPNSNISSDIPTSKYNKLKEDEDETKANIHPDDSAGILTGNNGATVSTYCDDVLINISETKQTSTDANNNISNNGTDSSPKTSSSTETSFGHPPDTLVEVNTGAKASMITTDTNSKYDKDYDSKRSTTTVSARTPIPNDSTHSSSHYEDIATIVSDVAGSFIHCGAQESISSETAEGFPPEEDEEKGVTIPPPSSDIVSEYLLKRGHWAGKAPRHLPMWGVLQYIAIISWFVFVGSIASDLSNVSLCFT